MSSVLFSESAIPVNQQHDHIIFGRVVVIVIVSVANLIRTQVYGLWLLALESVSLNGIR